MPEKEEYPPKFTVVPSEPEAQRRPSPAVHSSMPSQREIHVIFYDLCAKRNKASPLSMGEHEKRLFLNEFATEVFSLIAPVVSEQNLYSLTLDKAEEELKKSGFTKKDIVIFRGIARTLRENAMTK